jgi:type I restriction enzyme S subunit
VPEGWSSVALGQVVDARVEVSAPLPADRRPYIALEHMAQGIPRLLSWSYAEKASSAKAVFHRGDILFGKLRPNLRKAVQAPFDGVCSTDILVLRGRPREMEQAYLKQLVYWSKFQDYAVSTASGTKMPRTSWSLLRGFELLLPPIQEQERIASTLSSLDEAIEATQAVVEQLQAVRVAVLAELLSHGISGRHAKLGHTEFGDVPEEWDRMSLEELGSPGEQVVRSGPFGSSMKTKDFRSKGTPVLTIQSLGEGRVRPEGLFFVDDEKATELSEYKVRRGDLVFSRVADIGRSVAIDDASDGWLISPNLMRIRLDPARMNARFAMYAITVGQGARRQIEEIAGNAGRQVVSSSVLKRISLMVPPLAEQVEIAGLGQQIEDRLSSEVAFADALTTMKSALLPAFLTGEIRVTPDEAPA